ncbi:MAG: hypothetical protein ACI4RD_09875 [Kiritimatiellia bacterium]
MKGLLDRLHVRLGDFWWYSLTIFMAARFADCINVFVGLWLVPKYVPPSELGAVQPLASLAAFLATPIAVFATTFRQELSNLATSGQFGKVKTLLRSVFVGVGVVVFLAVVACRFLLPAFLTRIRIVEGSLGLIILAYAFVSAVAPIFSNALQSLKKFRATTVIALLGAPIRFLTMLASMPLRALSGYFVGQASTPAFSILTSVIALRKELSVPAEPYWTRPVVRRFARLFVIFGVGAAAAALATLVESTVLRQRLPEVESAAYYMVTRFSDIANFVTMTLLFTVFPFTAELAAKGRDTLPLLLKVAAAIVVSGALLALFFCLFGAPILRLLPNSEPYAAYWWAIPWMIAVGTISALASLYCSIEISANRFGYLWWAVPLHLLYPLLLLGVTGNGYFIDLLPPPLAAAVQAVNITSLKGMLWWMTGFQSLRVVCAALDGRARRARTRADVTDTVPDRSNAASAPARP